MSTAEEGKPSGFQRCKHILFGAPRSPHDRGVFHQLSLIAFFAWVGLGADGLSSTCYGPEQAYLALGNHPHLSIFVALATALTIIIISASYSQIIELFPTGGGGYVVASKLISPTAGMVAGSALLIDYVLTISISIASGADAVFSFLPHTLVPLKIWVALFGVIMLTIMNLRGVKESVAPLVPIFVVFVLTHAFALMYALVDHGQHLHLVAANTVRDVVETHNEVGLLGLLLVMLRAYGMGAGTYTGIEAVSNSMTILREPRVQTARKTMRYMSISLAVMAAGLMLAYLLYGVRHVDGKTLNAVLLESMTTRWSTQFSHPFILVTLISEAAILFIAAQAGFLSGPRVLANMAVDRWIPTRFASLSDQLVTHNGIVLMGGAALLTIIFTGGRVEILVVLYSINVFITFALSQLGMVLYARSKRGDPDPIWRQRLRVNGIALALTTFILISMIIMKFHAGGWITLLVTGGLIAAVRCVRAYYNSTAEHLKRLDSLVEAASISDLNEQDAKPKAEFDAKSKTAVILVNGFNGMGLHTLFAIIRIFGDTFKNYVFISVGMIDAGNFKGADEIGHLKQHVETQLNRYVNFMRRRGYYAESRYTLGVDALDEIDKMAPEIIQKYPKAVFFGGQLSFADNTLYSRWLHNYLVLAAQNRLHHRGIPFFIVPIRVQAKKRGEHNDTPRNGTAAARA